MNCFNYKFSQNYKKTIELVSQEYFYYFTAKSPRIGINRNFKLDNIESCFGYFKGCFVASLLAMTTHVWRRRRERDRCKITIDCLLSVLQFAAIPLTLHSWIQPCHCERSEAIPFHHVNLVI